MNILKKIGGSPSPDPSSTPTATPTCTSNNTCQNSCSRSCGSGTCRDNCGSTILCNTQACPSINGVDLKFNGSNGPVNLPNATSSQSGVLSWSVGSYGGGSLSCSASCRYTNAGETTNCSEFTGAINPTGTRTVTPLTTVKYSVGCTVSGSGTSASDNDSVDVNTRRYRCVFGYCQGNSKGAIAKYKHGSKDACTASCKSFLPER